MAKRIKRKFSESSGRKQFKRISRTISILKRKIVRWDRYRLIGKAVSVKNKNSRGKNWDTSGLKKHVQFLTKKLGTI